MGALVIFGIVWFVIWLRRRVTEKVLGMEGKLSSKDRVRLILPDMEMGTEVY